MVGKNMLTFCGWRSAFRSALPNADLSSEGCNIVTVISLVCSLWWWCLYCTVYRSWYNSLSAIVVNNKYFSKFEIRNFSEKLLFQHFWLSLFLVFLLCKYQMIVLYQTTSNYRGSSVKNWLFWFSDFFRLGLKSIRKWEIQNTGLKLLWIGS